MIDSKVSASAAGGAIATIVWTLLAVFVDQIGTLAPETLASLTGASTILLGFVLGYLTPNAASPVSGDGAGEPPADVA